MTFYKWSQTKDSNNTADSSCPFPEGQSPSSLNDGSRGQMAALAKFRDDISGAILTGGTSAAYTVFSYQGFDTLAHLHNQMIGFTPHTTNVDTVLFNVDGLGLKPLRGAPGVELPKGTLVQGTPYVAVYNNTDGCFYLRASYASPFNIPFLGGVDYWDTVTPSSAFIFPVGQALSRTVYAAAFAKWGTRFGAGDGSTTFNVPDKTGRVSAMLEAAATRLTSGAGGVDGATLGAVGGGQSQTLTIAQLPAHDHGTNTGAMSANASHSHAVSDASGNPTILKAGVGGSTGFTSGTQGVTAPSSAFTIAATNTDHTHVIPSQGGGAAHPIVQPTIVCNYIIRII